MAHWFDLQPCDGEFFDSAPFRYSYPMYLPVPAEQVWAGLVADAPLAWCKLLHNGHYTSERPFGVGTTRSVGVVRGALNLRERFFRWEEGRRHSFEVVQASVPAFKRLAEDYLIEDVPTGCRFTWTFAYESGAALGPLGRLTGPPNAAVFNSLVRDTRRHFGAK